MGGSEEDELAGGGLRSAAERHPAGPPARSDEEGLRGVAWRGNAAGPAQQWRLPLGSLVVGASFSAGAGTQRPAQRAWPCLENPPLPPIPYTSTHPTPPIIYQMWPPPPQHRSNHPLGRRRALGRGASAT